MLEDNRFIIEKIHLLKLASLSSSDQKWVLGKLKKQNKPLLKLIHGKLAEAKRFNLTFSDFNDIYNDLNLERYFEKNEIELKIEAINSLDKSKYDKFVNQMTFSDLILFLQCDESLKIKKNIISRIKTTKEYINNNIELKLRQNDKINAKLINYLYKILIVGNK